ncbi:MAG: RDD family protein [Chloroflexi bacterium]|nr:RDD family protein [Chloroflexota bacterium]
MLRERDGSAPGYGTGFIRAFVSLALWIFISILWLLDKLWCIWDRQKQTWHDKIAGTVVVAVR